MQPYYLLYIHLIQLLHITVCCDKIKWANLVNLSTTTQIVSNFPNIWEDQPQNSQLSFPISISKLAFSKENLQALGAHNLLIENFDTESQTLLYISLCQDTNKQFHVSVHLSHTHMNEICRTMAFFQQSLNQIAYSRNTNLLPLKLSTPSAQRVVDSYFIIIVYFISSSNVSSSNCLVLISLIKVALTLMLANTSLFCEMPIRMNLDDKD